MKRKIKHGIQPKVKGRLIYAENMDKENLLLELIKSMFIDFASGKYYQMRCKVHENGTVERWLSDSNIGSENRLNLYEIAMLTQIAIEHIWRVKNNYSPIFSNIFMPETCYDSYRKDDGKFHLGKNLFYNRFNVSFLKSFSYDELADILPELVYEYADKQVELLKQFYQ